MTDFVGQQVTLERAAVELLERQDVRAAVINSAQRWQTGTPDRLPETYAQLQDSIEEVALLVALQVVNSDPRRPHIVEISAGPHSWGGLHVPGGRWGINNPDTLYFAAPLEPDSRYVLTGRRHGSEPTDLNISVQTPDRWQILHSIGRRELAYKADGSFRITVGGRSAEDNHLPIGDGGSVLLIRQTLGNWDRELPYDLSIARIGGPPPGPSASQDDLAHQLIERLAVVIDHSLQTLQPPIFRLPANTIPPPGPPGDKPGYLVAQRNTLGHFQLDEDEALILVVTTGGAGYTAIAAPNIWGVTSDSARHQNSLNNQQAVLDPDGRITAVVANADPGIHNWVDPGGHRRAS